MNLESSYDCSNASEDLHDLIQQLQALELAGGQSESDEQQQQINHLRNQIQFIRNKCRIPGQTE